jgi:carbon storage regulator
MLVLSRKQKESIFINDNVVVTVLRIRGDQVKIGIEAPSDVPVHRKEIFEKIRGPDAERSVVGK